VLSVLARNVFEWVLFTPAVRFFSAADITLYISDETCADSAAEDAVNPSMCKTDDRPSFLTTFASSSVSFSLHIFLRCSETSLTFSREIQQVAMPPWSYSLWWHLGVDPSSSWAHFAKV